MRTNKRKKSSPNIGNNNIENFYNQTKKNKTEVKEEVERIDDTIRKKLKSFDLNYKYGPCLGISRLERWMRAEKLGKKPSREIFDILMKFQGVKEIEQNIWHNEL